MDDDEGAKALDPEATQRVVEAGRDIAKSVFADWAQIVCKGMDADAAAGFIYGIEVGLHMGMQDEPAAMMAALMIDFASHEGRTSAHETAHESIKVLRVLSAGRIGIVNEVAEGIEAMRPDVPGAGDERNN